MNNISKAFQIVLSCTHSLMLKPSPLNSKLFHPAFVHNSSTLRESALANISSNENVEEPDKLYKVIELEVRGNDQAVLKSYSWFATRAAEELGIKVGNCWTPKRPDFERLTLLKSVHIYKKHRVQYEVRTYFRFMKFHHLTGSTADTFLEYIERNLPEGVAMKVTKCAIEKLPEHITNIKK